VTSDEGVRALERSGPMVPTHRAVVPTTLMVILSLDVFPAASVACTVIVLWPTDDRNQPAKRAASGNYMTPMLTKS
jgi:hypothetical protein